MANNTVDFEHLPQIERLKQTSREAECLRLSFIVPDERGVMSLSPVGLGYIIYVELGVTSLAEAFAAGFQCATDI
jgi:hypothetical protein